MAKLSFSVIADTWRLFTPSEKRNIAFYILGIMLYKFGLEAFNGSITALATNRYDWEQDRAEAAGLARQVNTFQRVGLLQALNQTAQCLGSIMIAPLIKRFPTRSVLGVAVFTFALFTSILMIVDAATGGNIKPGNVNVADWGAYYGTYNSDGMLPIYTFTGIAYGMVELIRRVIPRDIVGGNVQKLRRMDALVHIFYEIAGTSGAFCTALALIPRLGNNFSFIITPIFFTAAAGSWFMISTLNFKPVERDHTAGTGFGGRMASYSRAMGQSLVLFGKSVFTGGRILFTSRKYVWLIPGYAFALYGHRYLENGISPVIARRYLRNSAWSQIMVGGSNFGELLGALFVFIFTDLIQTPMPWLRLDAMTLLIVWYLPFWFPTPIGSNPTRFSVNEAWKVAATFIPVSFGWAAGDVSLAAYIQASLARVEDKNKDVSALGAVMAFLYSTYIVLYAIFNPVLGAYIDRVDQADRRARGVSQGDVRPAVYNIAGVQFTVLAIIVIMATFIPKGAFRFNPSMINEEKLDHDLDEVVSVDGEKMDVKQPSDSDDETRRGQVQYDAAAAVPVKDANTMQK
ncbi:hypothetical protein CAC42_3697 [Sphaceloma murrayae]|uniref:Uncharacterized protein n=1 Tax=Sphaceloma murrayae TaxID=2082308 RepID=A0A2K1QHK2_9PEZI|nr:hypothetical protein CAC42_3697 [Sphaceloma murrayae]